MAQVEQLLAAQGGPNGWGAILRCSVRAGVSGPTIWSGEFSGPSRRDAVASRGWPGSRVGWLHRVLPGAVPDKPRSGGTWSIKASFAPAGGGGGAVFPELDCGAVGLPSLAEALEFDAFVEHGGLPVGPGRGGPAVSGVEL